MNITMKTISILIIYLLLFSSLAFAEGEVANLKQYQYWDNGKTRQCDVFDTNGYLKARGFCRYDGTVEKIEKYSQEGKMVEEALYDQSGKMKAGIDGWAAMRWWYDGSILRSQISYNEYGRPLERKQYSDGGKLVLRQYITDEDEVPYEDANMYILLGANNVKYYDPTENIE